MTYTPTLFVHNASPGVSAVELNKLGNGVATAATTADSALLAAATANASAQASALKFRRVYRRVRGATSAPITDTRLVTDGVLTVTVATAPNACFLVQARILYVADAYTGGRVAVFAYNGQPSRHSVADGGVSAYTYVEAPGGISANPTILAWDHLTSAPATIDGGGLVTDAATLTSVVVNGDATGTLTIGIAAAQGDGVSSVDFQILAGSYLTVEQVG